MQLEVEWRCVSVFTKGVCEVDLDCGRIKSEVKILEMEVGRLE